MAGLSDTDDRPVLVAGWTQIQIRKREAKTDRLKGFSPELEVILEEENL